MTFEEALTRSPIKTVRVLTAGKIGVGDGNNPVDTPVIIRQMSDGTAKAFCTDKKKVTWRATLNSEKYAQFKRDCLELEFHCKPLDE